MQETQSIPTDVSQTKMIKPCESREEAANGIQVASSTTSNDNQNECRVSNQMKKGPHAENNYKTLSMLDESDAAVVRSENERWEKMNIEALQEECRAQSLQVPNCISKENVVMCLRKVCMWKRMKL